MNSEKVKIPNAFAFGIFWCARQRKKHCVESQRLCRHTLCLGHNAFFLFRCKSTSLGFAASNFVASCIKQFCLREAGRRQKFREESLCASMACPQSRSRSFCLFPTQSIQTVRGPLLESGSSELPHRPKRKTATVWLRFSFWCARRDLNPHARSEH